MKMEGGPILLRLPSLGILVPGDDNYCMHCSLFLRFYRRINFVAEAFVRDK